MAWCCGTLRFVCVCAGVLVMSLRELQTKVAREGATAAGFLKRRIDIENRVIDMTGTEVRAKAQFMCIPSCRCLWTWRGCHTTRQEGAMTCANGMEMGGGVCREQLTTPMLILTHPFSDQRMPFVVFFASGAGA